MQILLEKLRGFRRARKELEQAVSDYERPHLDAMHADTALYRQALTAVRAEEERLNESANLRYARLAQDRMRALLEGPAPQIPLIPGCSVRHLPRIVIVDAEAVPRQFCAPDVKALLKTEGIVPGVRRVIQYSFAFR